LDPLGDGPWAMQRIVWSRNENISGNSEAIDGQFDAPASACAPTVAPMSMLQCCVRFARRLVPGGSALAWLRRLACAALYGAACICQAQAVDPPAAASGLGVALEQQVKQLAMSS
jgi:flagella basal body P-ring formation protein FlgA